MDITNLAIDEKNECSNEQPRGTRHRARTTARFCDFIVLTCFRNNIDHTGKNNQRNSHEVTQGMASNREEQGVKLLLMVLHCHDNAKVLVGMEDVKYNNCL